MMELVRAVCFATRQLRKSPGFTTTIILTLALGIGVTTAMFSLIEGIPLRFTLDSGYIVLRSGAAPGQMIGTLPEAIAEVDPQLALPADRDHD